MRLNLMPRSLFARMALILLTGLLVAQSISLWLHWSERATVVSQARGLHLTDRIAEVVRLLEAEPPQQRSKAMVALQTSDLRVAEIETNQIFPHAPRGQMQATLSALLGGDREIRAPGGMGMGAGMGGMGRGGGGPGMQQGNPLRSIDVRLNDGQWIRIVASREPDAPALPTDFFVHLLISLLIVTGVIMIAVRQATKPLQQLAHAADAFGRDLDAPALVEAGPSETRLATQAFNRMQQRIRRLVDERSRALAAVSHDLRTPLTRLRLRAELVDDDKLRDQIAADLDAMTTMIDSTLDYLRGLQENEPTCPIDINALLQSLIDDAAVLGRQIEIEGTAHHPFNGRLSALRRALQNLIDNAIKYGHGAHLSIEDHADNLKLIVEDKGPGIPPEELTRVAEPYYRPDASRSHETGGVGLGLSIVTDIARLHGGELILANRPEGGLRATLLLPRTVTPALQDPAG